MERIPAGWLPHYTYWDYQQWENKWELIRGVPYAMSPGSLRKHQLVGGKFVYLAVAQIREQSLACNCEVLYEADWRIDEDTVVRPDVMILCDAPESDYVQVPPALVVEIFSPATRLKDRNLKFRLYETNGVRYYLMIDPERQAIEMYQLHNNAYTDYSGDTFQLNDRCSVQLNLNQLWQ